jgi:hypothetical protein
LFARTLARGRWNATLDRWINFHGIASTPERLGRYIFARGTEPNVTKIWTLMQSTCQLLVALNHAKMATFGICTSTNWTADLFTMVLLAFFELIANSLALQIFDAIDLLFCHKFALQVIRIVDLETRELCLGFVTNAAFVNHLFALHAIVIVALLDALMLSTGQEALTERITNGNWLFAAFTLST